jgi:FkbM family methyltransferase
MNLPRCSGGYQFACDLRDAIALEVCFTGQYEPQETALLKALLRPSMTFLDVGANWGYFTLLAAHRVGSSGRVISLEPDPRLFRLLCANIACNGLHQVTALKIAAADQPGMLALMGYDERGSNFGLSRLGRRLAGPEPREMDTQTRPFTDSGQASLALEADDIPVAASDRGQPLFAVFGETLDALLDQHHVETVDLLKMDIEGAEGLALSGLARSLKQRRVKRFLLELHPAQLAEQGCSCAAVLDRLLEAGYRVFNINHSSAGSRRTAYAKEIDPRSLLRPLEQEAPLDPWPHVLCTGPGTDLLP